MSYIPRKIDFYCQPETQQKATSGWRWWRRHKKAVTCIPAWPVSHRLAADAQTRRNALTWGQKPKNNTMITLDNTPKGGYKVVGAEQRGEGGKAWKVLSPEGYLVDMREDVFMPILLDRGLAPDGTIDAKFQWCQDKAQLRLEEVGSEQHKQYSTEAQKFSKARRIQSKDLKVGMVYEFNEFCTRCYVGRVRHQGKLKYAWIWLGFIKKGSSQLECQTVLNDEWCMSHGGRGRFKTLTVTGSVSVRREIHMVTLPNLTEVQRWTDGHGEPLPDAHTASLQGVST